MSPSVNSILGKKENLALQSMSDGWIFFFFNFSLNTDFEWQLFKTQLLDANIPAFHCKRAFCFSQVRPSHRALEPHPFRFTDPGGRNSVFEDEGETCHVPSCVTRAPAGPHSPSMGTAALGTSRKVDAEAKDRSRPFHSQTFNHTVKSPVAVASGRFGEPDIHSCFSSSRPLRCVCEELQVCVKAHFKGGICHLLDHPALHLPVLCCCVVFDELPAPEPEGGPE